MFKGSTLKWAATIAVAAVIGVAVLSASPALAAKGGRGASNSTSSITLNEPAPHFGDWITFTVSSEAGNDWVNARCSQSGQIVYSQWEPVNNHSAGVFVLGPTSVWTGGGASCEAELVFFVNGRERSQGLISFSALP